MKENENHRTETHTIVTNIDRSYVAYQTNVTFNNLSDENDKSHNFKIDSPQPALTYLHTTIKTVRVNSQYLNQTHAHQEKVITMFY